MASQKLFVAAIDLGTTYSGWGFSMFSEFQKDPTKVHTKHWHSSGQLFSEKAPTCVLVKPDGKTLEAFGYDAENKYLELAEEDEHLDYFYFRRFKMKLNKSLQTSKQLTRTLKLEDVTGKTLPALVVFSLATEFLVSSLLEECNETVKGGSFTVNDARWVLTVPAIWTDAAKQFMREAAEKAKIPPHLLTIALEPEAASMFYRHIPVSKTSEEANIAKFKLGDKFMVLDAGGGTVDIAVHQVASDGGINEIVAASGGGWGGMLVDKAFEDLLADLFGKQLFLAFKKEHPDDYIELCRDFEIKKRTIHPVDDSKIRIKIPLTLSGGKFEENIKTSKYAEKVKINRDKLVIEAPVARELFIKAITNTMIHVKNMMRKPEMNGLSAILMVGGFSDSPMLKGAIVDTFAQKTAIVKPRDAGLSILKGAVIYGHDPKEINERVLKYTYGVNIWVPFVEGEHPDSKKIATDHGERCKDVFHKHVEINQTVKVGEKQIEKIYKPVYHGQKVMVFNVFASESMNPMYTDDGCTHIGTFKVDMPDLTGELDREVLCSFTFSGTEITVDAVFTNTGEITSATFDFL